MPKSRKRKNADFQKVKLKVGKKLPKGDNVTNLSFKTRQIQIKQRIRDGDTKELTTKRHLSVQDLLRQCDHHSSTSRVNAVSGLKEVWLTHHEELMVLSNVHGYGEILKKLSGMLIDNEAVVRHSVINLCKLIFNRMCSQNKSLGGKMIGGDLFRHIHVFLCCAMNHIHEDVRLDSLVLFDALLGAFPQFMVQHTSGLLGNLVAMISAPISLGAKGDKTTQKLSMNPESKLQAMKFRARVLQRIKCTLQEALNCCSKDENQLFSRNVDNVERIWSFHFDSKDKLIRQSTVFVPQNCKRRFQFIFSNVSNEMDHSIFSPVNLEYFMYQSIPVLLQCWREARATTSTSFVFDSGATSDSADVMSLVLDVINSLFSLASTNISGEGPNFQHDMRLIPPSVLVKNYCSDFASVFMDQFPFSVQVETQVQKKKRKKKSMTLVDNAGRQQSLVALNLDICHVMSCFCTDPSATLDNAWLRRIQTYIIKIIQGSPTPAQCQILVKVLKNIYSKPSSLAHCTPAFKAAFDFYHQSSIQSPERTVFFDLFTSMFTTWDGWRTDISGPKPLSRYHHNNEVEEILNAFHASLSTLLQEIQGQKDALTWAQGILHLLSHGMNCLGVTQHVEECLSHILHPETGLLASNIETVQYKVLALLAQGPGLKKEHFQHLLYGIRRPVKNPSLPHRKSKSMACHAIGSVSLGIQKCLPLTSQKEFHNISSSQHDQLSNYLKFMFSLQIGMNKEELKTLTPSKTHVKGAPSVVKWLNVDLTLSDGQWERHTAVATYAAVELTDFHIPASLPDGYLQPFTFIGSIEHLWIQNVTTYRAIHIMSAYSLIKFVQLASLPHSTEKPSPKLCSLTSVVIASVLANLYRREAKSQGLVENMVDDIKRETISCLSQMPSLLQDVWSLLSRRSDGSLEIEISTQDKQCAVMALELLRSEDVLMQNISSMDTS